MTTDRALTAIVQSWMEEGPTDLPDRILDAVLDQVPATRQRRFSWPAWRFADMNGYAKFLVATAAIVAVALVGFNLLAPRNGGVPGATQGPPTASPSPSAAAALATPKAAPPNGPVDAGTYRVTEPWFTRSPLTLTLPDGWQREDNVFWGPGPNTYDGDGVGVASWPLSHVFRDSCQWTDDLGTDNLRPVGPPEEVVRALVEQLGHDTSAPTDTTLGGYPATRMELSVPTDFDIATCHNAFMRLWPDEGPKMQYGLPIEPGQRFAVYVVDLDGAAQLVIGTRTEHSSAADVAAMEQVIESIRFD